MNTTKKERWTEAEVLALPAGEHDYFDRKSGRLLLNNDFRDEVSKALSAFANSGGGHVLFGVANDGTFDGVEPLKGRTPTREWLEQIIPDLVRYPLKDFRVHEVEPSSPTAIPQGKVLIVVDIGDSILAPHQSRNGTYYYRAGSHSSPAPHFYLETLRNRLVSPVLTPELTNARYVTLQRSSDGIVEVVWDRSSKCRHSRSARRQRTG
jgi:predicted HTH transcriptional regulator